MKGLTSMEPDLLDECVARLKTAEALAKSDAKWYVTCMSFDLTTGSS